ncbi:MAG: nitroreductase family protein [Clostridia bacterium]|nr:nitroreductase family protein [Clostridia bacterium]
MSFYDLVLKNRSVRAFDESRVITREELEYLVSLARVTPSAVNKQPLKYFLACDSETNAKILPMTAWAGLLSDVQLPPKGHAPMAYIVICTDQDILKSSEKDVGIVAQTMLLGAADMGLSGCMIGAFKGELHEVLELPENLKISLVVALGKCDENIEIVDIKDGETAYFRDEKGNHFVPKRTMDELIVNGGAK